MSSHVQQAISIAKAQRSCWQRVTDHKAWYVGLGVVVLFALLFIAAVAGVVNRSQQECIKTDGAGLWAVVFFGISMAVFLIVSIFACCAANTNVEWEERKASAISGHSTSATSARVRPEQV